MPSWLLSDGSKSAKTTFQKKRHNLELNFSDRGSRALLLSSIDHPCGRTLVASDSMWPSDAAMLKRSGTVLPAARYPIPDDYLSKLSISRSSVTVNQG